MTISSISITPELIAAHGLNNDEYEQILILLGRQPNITELGIFSAMWNEHCAYKSSKKWLRLLPTKGPYVIQGPGENAGIIDIGDDDCLVFKMESHNHPSYIEPYQGAATGVGGILRDIFTMGARPIVLLNSLRFGEVNHSDTKRLVAGVVSGIAGYGNSFGVPTIGGELEFCSCYNGNILVNVFAAGLVKKDAIFFSKAEGVGLPIIYLGAKTGRDGVGGASMASTQFDETIHEKMPTVQVGDPFTEKCLLEACLELMATGTVIAVQDMGAAGLTCSAVEMGAKSNLGIELNLDAVPIRESKMTAYEMMLSESQERMLIIVKSGEESKAKQIFQKWGLDSAVIGKTTNDLRFRVFHHHQEVANLPIKELADQAPEYDRPSSEPIASVPVDFEILHNHKERYNDMLVRLIGSPNQSSRRWVYEQYDTIIQGNSLQLPGGDAGVVRVEGHKSKALAFSSDVTPRYVEADPFEGSKQAVAECWRNITATGAYPLAATDNLNFGNPEKKEVMGQFIASIKGIREACQILNFPIVSGNVSLYNENNDARIFPTPTIAGVGILPDWSLMARINSANEGDYVLMIGQDGSHLDCSSYLIELTGYCKGPPPKVDLLAEQSHGNFVRSLICKKQVTACHDISSGGLAITLAEMIISSGKGMDLSFETCQGYPISLLFGEDQGRYVITVPAHIKKHVCLEASKQAIPLRSLGRIGGDSLIIKEIISIPIIKLRQAYENWFPGFMDNNVVYAT
ncbi:Phosphoribosylformylglycinamidine synthase, synthetase subunit [Liberibacter crescens BT-1]|uniref:Phosphoribosylformylglycinamidine synthase subunit PurL n=1 Tax=Liberibacter crescens (strain BT-1) TaxID=1215343 RepID=L0EV63_LIBCB|nr:phosphoribosylformylglycinamidine synthase subunit PurL [Liberibacter crescens]AGA64523.1 Phosphoribosylformylglycinamidine synthase, synthetase subunit [Liberibacter crescens BT-1]AMC12675.1 phosphoribosylformylglycinamidine synthase [Liberibacter crescens]